MRQVLIIWSLLLISSNLFAYTAIDLVRANADLVEIDNFLFSGTTPRSFELLEELNSCQSFGSDRKSCAEKLLFDIENEIDRLKFQ